MSKKTEPLGQIRTRQRDLWIITSLVLVALAAGMAVVWPSVQSGAIEQFGPDFPAVAMLGVLLFLIVFLVIYLWMKGVHLNRLLRELVLQHGQNEGLRLRLASLRAVLEASAQIKVDQNASEGLQLILEEVTRSLRGDRVVLYRTRADGSGLERDAAFPSTAQAPPPSLISFEDDVAQAVVRSGVALLIGKDTDPKELGIQTPRPRRGVRSMAGTPLLLEGRPAGAIVVTNPSGMFRTELDEEGIEYLEIFAGFAASLIRNLRLFQEVARRNAELDRIQRVLTDHQRDVVNIETISILGRIACSLTHALSGPMMSLHGYTEILVREDPKSSVGQSARRGLHAEFIKLRDRLQSLIDYTASYRMRFELADLSELLDSCVAVATESLHAGAVDLVTDIYQNLPLTVVDPVRLRQVFSAFLDFASQSLSTTPPPRRLVVKMLPVSGRIRVQFLFHAKASIAEIVEPLLNPNVEIGPIHRQHGLSLAIACNILRNHQTEIGVEYEEDKRVVMTFEVPIRRDPPPAPRRTFALMADLDPDQAPVEQVIDYILNAGARGELPEPQATAGDLERAANLAAHVPSGRASEAPAAPVAPAQPAAAPPPGPPAPQGMPGAGLNEVFRQSDLWAPGGKDAASPVAPPPPRNKTRKSVPLLDPGEVEDALKLFDGD